MRPPDPRLIAVLEPFDRHVSDLVLAMREIVLDEAPDASESVYEVSYTVAVWFGFSGKMKDMFCYVAAYATHANLGFPRGTALSDPHRILEGTGKTMRHIKLRTLSDVDSPLVRRYIRAAMEQVGTDGAGNGKTVVKARGAASKAKRRTTRKR
jgi:hypothetical protein